MVVALTAIIYRTGGIMQLTNVAKKNNGWGGAGRSQGRKPLNGEAKMMRITVTLAEEDVALLDRLSPFMPGEDGVRVRSRSEGVRWALRALQRENETLLAEVARMKAEIEADPSLTVTDEELERDIAAKIAAMKNGESSTHVEN
jgi:metal-responsive CopG/Arc/MetJ family transcriptional regulator